MAPEVEPAEASTPQPGPSENVFDDIPAPAILNDFSRTERGSVPKATSGFRIDEIDDEQPVLEKDGIGPDLQDADAAVRKDAEPALPAEEPSEVDLTAESPFLDRAVPVQLHVDEETIASENAPDAVAERPVEADSSESDEAAALPHVEDADVQYSIAGDAAESIGKPADDLSPYDSYQSPSVFDSVRIMEPGTAGSPEDVDTRVHPLSGRIDRIPTAEPNSHSDEAAMDQASATSHGIGKVDTDGKRSSKLKPLAEGIVLNCRYEIIRKIGGGGMGAVYLASDNNLGGVLRAVKEMVQTHIEEEQQEKAINDFKRESMILSSLDHVSIPTIYDYFYDEKESRFYLVMKYISGGDLSSRLRAAQEGRVDERSVCEWAVQIIDVLDYLHNQPSTIVYRDLKPSNIMIDGNSGRAMLIDFGIARSISQREEKGVTAVGTMGYAPPELFSGNVEPRSDIYSLGSTMFHLLTGADPQSNPLLIFDFQKNPRPRQINPQLSDQIERIIMKAVQYSADERYRSAAEMRDVLDDHLLKLKAGIVTFGVGEVPASISLSNQSVFCGFCGQRIVATDMFCAFCGAKQPIAQHGVHSEVYSQTGWTAKLVIEGTSELSVPAFSLQKDDNLLGRRDPMSNIFPEVDLSKYDPQTKISRRHARIWREGHNFLLEDLGSSNGTMLTRSGTDPFRLLPKQPQVLSAGDRIRLGDATLHFIIG